ncbi:shikimate dehydrogenase family protein [Candidatus Omnitrophota bacterium]
MKTLGIVTLPNAQTDLPKIYNDILKTAGLSHEYEYRHFEVAETDFTTFFESAAKNNIWGLQLTPPFNEKIIGAVSLSEEFSFLRQVQSIDAIIRKDNVWVGHNTEVIAFTKELKAFFKLKGKNAVVFGVGYSARCATYVLASEGAEEIAVFAKDRKKTRALAEAMKPFFPACQIYAATSIDDVYIEKKELFVNATALGRKKIDAMPIEEGLFHKDLSIFDFIYDPPETKLIHRAQMRGLRTCGGRGIFLEQIKLSFELFTGKSISDELLQRVLSGEGKKTKFYIRVVLIALGFWLLVYLFLLFFFVD